MRRRSGIRGGRRACGWELLIRRSKLLGLTTRRRVASVAVRPRRASLPLTR
ncbi:hypothetical protein LINPERPRIM_LOCUS13118 [Linum perenne]